MKALIIKWNAWLLEHNQCSENSKAHHLSLLDSEARLSSLGEEAKLALTTLVYSKQGQQRIARQMQQWQHDLTMLLNQLNQIEMPEVKKSALTKFLLVQCSHLEQHYPIFFNTAALMPDLMADEIKKNISNDLTLLQAALKQCKIGSELAAIIIQTFEQLKLKKACSYRAWRYWQLILEKLIRFCKNVANGELENLLQEYLIYLRFDSLTFYHYLRTQLGCQLDHCVRIDERYDLLCELKKKLLVQPEHNNILQQDLGLALREMLLDFVLAELTYLQRRQTTEKNHQAVLQDQYRVSVGISVDCLAYLLKLAIAVGLVNASPRSTFFSFVAQHFQTPGIGDAQISVNSLNAKYKQVVQHTAVKVRLLLRRMIKEIETEFDLG